MNKVSQLQAPVKSKQDAIFFLIPGGKEQGTVSNRSKQNLSLPV